MTKKRLLGIAGTESGSGKTLVTMGYLRALQKRGLDPQPFKVGPDFIDPLYHESVSDRPSVTLDRFFLDSSDLQSLVDRSMRGADVGLIEGVMGLYDGKAGQPGQYSTAELFSELDVPYVLVLSAAGQSHSIAAKVKGFVEFDPELDCLGVVLTRVASQRHESMLRSALNRELSLPVLGSIPRDESIRMPSRHLGLDTAFLFDNETSLAGSIDRTVTSNLELPEDLPPGGSSPNRKHPSVFDRPPDAEITVGVARDDAFHFYYDYNLRRLRDRGANLVEVSPLGDDRLPGDLDGLLIGGGYPEQFAVELSSNESFVEDLRGRLGEGMPLLAECGGLIYLSEELTDRSDRTHSMVGWFPLRIRQTETRQALGYVSGETTEDHPFLEPGETMKGHEFHYSKVERIDGERYAVRLSDGDGLREQNAGLVKENSLGSYVHWHFGSTPVLADGFLEACRRKEPRHV